MFVAVVPVEVVVVVGERVVTPPVVVKEVD